MSSSNVYGLILAGGSGSRLWPISREMYPKQLLKIADEYTLFQSTFLRLIDCIDDKNILSITNVKHEGQVRYQLDELREKFCRKSSYRVISEPVGKNTAPAIALAIKYIEALNNKKFDPVIVATPSDHCIYDNKKFARAVEEAIKLAENDFVMICPKKATKVKRISKSHVLQGVFIRQNLESAVIREKFSDIKEKMVVDALEKIIEKQEIAAKNYSIHEHFALDDEFHHTIIMAAGFDWVQDLILAVKGTMDRVRFLSIEHEVSPIGRTCLAHRAVLNAIKDNNPEKAAHAMYDHMKETSLSLEEVIAKCNPDFFDL